MVGTEIPQPLYRCLCLVYVPGLASRYSVVAMLLSGVLCDYGFAGGWPSVFYVFGVVGCVWSAAWFLLVYDSLATHPRISTTEREYWEKMIGTTELVTRPPTPWRKILTSLPVWALTVAFFVFCWGFSMTASAMDSNVYVRCFGIQYDEQRCIFRCIILGNGFHSSNWLIR